ncbi:MAG: hypothetical protein KGL16_13510 [Acidobacteriota bacterium]|nr:hypothetical protein [Acidobacteriota bacterium]
MAISVGAVCVVVLVVGQFLVPPLATTILRHRLAKDGRVLSAHVSAFPWFELLWQHADSVTARLADYDAVPGHLKRDLQQAARVGTVRIAVDVLHTGLLTLHDVSLTKRGDELVGAAQLDLHDLQAALPIVQSLTPAHDAAGQLVLRGKASVFGVSATVDLVVAARDGDLVVAPAGLLGAFATLTLFEDPQIRVQSVSATAVPGGVRFVARGRFT